MKRFFINSFIFCAIVFALAVMVDVFVSHGLRRTSKGQLEVVNMVMQDTPRYDVIVLGNSRGVCGYDTRILDSILHCNSYNISLSGKGFRMSDLCYKAYRRNNPSPKMVIVNIDYLEMGEGALGFEKYMFYPYIMDTLVKPVLEMNHFSFLDRNLPLYRYRGDYKCIGVGLGEFFCVYHFSARTYKGYYPNPNGEWEGDALRRFIKKKPRNFIVDADTAVIEIFDAFLAQAKKEGVNVVMVNAPLYCQVQQNLIARNDTLVSVYKGLSEKYEVPIIDYQASAINQDSIYFKDGIHMNQLGAEVFTTQLAHDIDSLRVY